MKWMAEELKILKKLWIRIDINKFDIAEILYNHSPSAISKKASDLQLKKEYTPKIDTEKLKEVELYEI